MSAIRKVGIVGLGRMGAPMAQHLLAKGFTVSGCDPAAQARDRAQGLGIAVLGSPREVAQSSDLVIVVVGYDDEVETAAPSFPACRGRRRTWPSCCRKPTSRA